MVNKEYLGFKLLVGQMKEFENVFYGLKDY